MKLMVVVPRFFLLCAVWLALPAIAAAQPTPLAVQRVWTQDAGGNDKTTFAPGETIRLAAQLNNSYGGYLLGANGTQLTLTTSFYNDAKPADIPPGVSTWTWDATAPAEQNSYTVTVQAYDHFHGVWAMSSASFAISSNISAPSVTVDQATTRDGDGNEKAPFTAGDAIQFAEFVTNHNSTPVTAVFAVRATDPSGATIFTSEGWTIDLPPGLSNIYTPWTLPANAPAGTYTFTVTVTYNGASSQGQSQFDVQPPSQVVNFSKTGYPEGKGDNLIVLVHGCCTKRGDLGEWHILAKRIRDKIISSQTPGSWEIAVLDWTTHILLEAIFLSSKMLVWLTTVPLI